MAGETAARLRILGYPGSLGEPSALDAALDAGARSVEFTGLCSWLVSQLKSVCPSIEESISPTQGPEEADSFQLEASGVVSELHCPYTALTTGEVTTRLTSRDNCLNLLRFLMSELQAARVLKVADPPPVETDRRGDGGRARGEIQLICQALEIEPKSLHNPALLTEVQNMVSLRLHALPDSGVMNPLLKRQLNSELWGRLAAVSQALRVEYECRMRMLIKRFQVTVQSFHWGERGESRSSSMSSVIFPLEAALLPVSLVSLSHLLAAREDTSRIVKTSSGSSRLGTSCAVNKILMGSVPDRGGRPGEIEPPMPSWERRRGGGRPQHQQRRLPGKKRKDK
ncbi:protein FAM98A-like isoform X1 [Polyodon spathula]|uniref:protein FAM98A-like isoform X1 n=1 Tax=Polyodon spathula TaxID=7913 RepID=UPI001B7E65F7|nr:protein FAM98A-like isoform X1 [Polyodon spathula]